LFFLRTFRLPPLKDTAFLTPLVFFSNKICFKPEKEGQSRKSDDQTCDGGQRLGISDLNGNPDIKANK